MTESQSESALETNIEVVMEEVFYLIVERRGFEVAGRKARKSERYKQAHREYLIAFENLQNSLCDEKKKMVNTLEEAVTALEAVSMDYAYRQGLEDSPMIHKELKKFGLH